MPPLAAHAVPSIRPDQIIAAACRLFARHGYRRTAMDDIAREAGVAKATLYLHFEGKEAIFRGLIERCRYDVAERVQVVLANGEAPLSERLAAMTYAYYGTALEWFGDASFLGELKALVSQDPEIFGPTAAPRLKDHLVGLVQAAATLSQADATRAGGAEAVAQLLIDAAIGAKQGAPQPSGPLYRQRLLDAARVIEAALAPPPEA